MVNKNNIKEETVIELKYLSDKIDKNIARQEDYSRYHELLNIAGIDDATIKQKLSKFNIDNIEEFYRKRKEGQYNQTTEGGMLGVVLGLALVVLFLWSLNQNVKK